MINDPLGDLLTRIRNGQRARKDSVLSPASKLRARVLDVLQREGYIRGYSEEKLGDHPGLRIELKYFEGQPAIQHVARVSKPGRRVYSGSQDLPRVRNGLGMNGCDPGITLAWASRRRGTALFLRCSKSNGGRFNGWCGLCVHFWVSS